MRYYNAFEWGNHATTYIFATLSNPTKISWSRSIAASFGNSFLLLMIGNLAIGCLFHRHWKLGSTIPLDNPWHYCLQYLDLKAILSRDCSLTLSAQGIHDIICYLLYHGHLGRCYHTLIKTNQGASQSCLNKISWVYLYTCTWIIKLVLRITLCQWVIKNMLLEKCCKKLWTTVCVISSWQLC